MESETEKGRRESRRGEEEKRKTILTFFHSVFFHSLSRYPPLASVFVSDFRSKESDVTVMELLRRCFFSLLHTHANSVGVYCNAYLTRLPGGMEAEGMQGALRWHVRVRRQSNERRSLCF